MTDRKFDDGDALAGGLFGHSVLRKRAAVADAVGHDLDAANLLHRGIENQCIAELMSFLVRMRSTADQSAFSTMAWR
jgi:hypothetical protein